MFGRNKERREADETNKAAEEHSYFHESNDWEAKRIAGLEKSERRAWMVTGGAVAVAVLLALAIVLMMPLKEKIPYVWYLDKVTGVPDLVSVLDEKQVGYDEVKDKYWLALYVRARETYDWYTIQNDYDTVGLLSSPDVGREYASRFEGDDAMDKVYGSQIKETVKLLSIVPNGSGIATVRFIKTTKRTDDTGPGKQTQWVATIGYEYRNPSRLKESERLVNPFGFRATSYRVDPELVGGSTR